MSISLIGYSGFVGQQLIKDYGRQIGNIYNSKNIKHLPDMYHDTIIIAAPSAVKWQANKNPKEDLAKVQKLIDALLKTSVSNVIHISTCDVFDYSKGNRNFELDQEFSDQPYSKHRRMLEEAVQTLNSHILRLPTIYGEGMKKNILFDLLTKNYDYLDTVNPYNRLQWINVTYIKPIIDYVIKEDIKILNVATQPIANKDIFDLFNYRSKSLATKPDIVYDMKTTHQIQGYMMSKKAVLGDMRKFIDEKSHLFN